MFQEAAGTRRLPRLFARPTIRLARGGLEVAVTVPGLSLQSVKQGDAYLPNKPTDVRGGYDGADVARLRITGQRSDARVQVPTEVDLTIACGDLTIDAYDIQAIVNRVDEIVRIFWRSTPGTLATTTDAGRYAEGAWRPKGPWPPNDKGEHRQPGHQLRADISDDA